MTMGTVHIDGIATRFEVSGSGPALLMYSPGGFNGQLENWRDLGIYRRTEMLDRLRERFTCITFDKRESGQSGGRVERIGWRDYARQGIALLDHLGVERAHAMGGCVGCSVAAVAAVEWPERVSSLVLYSPAGGVKYRMKQHVRFIAHQGFAAAHGLDAVVELARSSDAGFAEDGRVGPWVSVLRRDEEFATTYAKLDPERYAAVVSGLARTLFDRDTVPGPEPEDLLVSDVPALIVSGQDTSHAPSAARYLHECLSGSQIWDVPVAEQTRDSAPARVIDFFDGAGG